MSSSKILQQLLNRYSTLSPLEGKIEESAEIIINSFRNGGKVLACGNGGSSSDADHIVGELMKSFEGHRPLNPDLQKKIKEISPERGDMLSEKLQQGLPAVSLSAHTALTTAIANDINSDVVFAQQVTGLGNKGDVLIGLSTSGNSKNVVDALIVAKAKGLITIGLTGETGGKMKDFCDVLINVPEKRTAYVQELHLPVYHAICMIVECEMFGRK
ncbi:D-sedoheptulose 7-phosphate isomerase [Mariniphaga anaerophila]|uniref:D-sedoheptulose 7-phosphate isomerase n=1 Tax=Mariniphaga anaerophila TaxID=1484053 RepID=A0A1M4ZZD7_9BACT|nr:SIS domain-containing protein [Mariniphaga anaerophila]SHF23389.1 D-sedoheptulose 7-phosphate isomerase [Mariniphaga anaerophila]